MKDETFLSRWLRRKNEARAETTPPAARAVPAEPAPVVIKPGAGTQPPAPAASEPAPASAPQPLPPVESLTPQSDFVPFMQPEVDAGLKRRALKTLFQDPKFNVMDGLDVYIDDYSKPDPLPEGWLEKLNQVKRLGIFNEPEEIPAAEPAPQVEAAQKPAKEQPIAPVAEPGIADTSDAGIPAPPMRESH